MKIGDFMSRTMVKILFFSSLVLFSSCVSIPKQTAEMSVLLEQQLDALKQANNSIIENVYKEKEKNVTDYVDNIWFPQYLEEYFQKPIIQEAWNEAVNTDSLEYRLELIQTLTQICMEEYKTYKESLLSPIYAEKDTILRNFNEQYDLALKMNSIITRNVKSASDLQSEYKSYLNKIVSTEKLDSITQSSLDKIDKQFDNVIEGFDKYEDKINSIINKIK
ncbi:ATP synthase F1 [Bacteroides eggerthii 1_2_48FAA]|uniref:ATP synthase F1 n=2 Tax=Bacteroides TaxID=816 RepID=E5X2J8_9BACE|nr:ATP synthase F1 [Bacteroides eggerthii 1_2_48FAA]